MRGLMVESVQRKLSSNSSLLRALALITTAKEKPASHKYVVENGTPISSLKFVCSREDTYSPLAPKKTNLYCYTAMFCRMVIKKFNKFFLRFCWNVSYLK